MGWRGGRLFESFQRGRRTQLDRLLRIREFAKTQASYLHAYNRHKTHWKGLALVPIDEAFSNLSGERIHDCIKAMAELDLQGMFSMSNCNISCAFSLCDEWIVITKKEECRGFIENNDS